MNKQVVAKQLVKIARCLVADKAEYYYDPEHRIRPAGGGWRKTKKGWSRVKREDNKVNPRVDSGDEGTRASIAIDVDTNAPTLDKLSQDKSWVIRAHVARNSNTSGETLGRLAKDGKIEVREAVAQNRNTPPEALDALSRDKQRIVQCFVAENPSTPTKTLDKLCDFTQDKKEEYKWVRMRLAKNPNMSTESLAKLADYSDDEIHQIMYSQKKAHYDTLWYLADNPHTGPDVIDRLACIDSSVDHLIVNNPNTSYDTLKRISKKSTYYDSPYNNSRETAKSRCRQMEQEKLKSIGFDLSKLSPQLREKVKGWDMEDIEKFIAWISNRG